MLTWFNREEKGEAGNKKGGITMYISSDKERHRVREERKKLK